MANPKAAYLALHGLRPMKHKDRGEKAPRIRWHLKDDEQQLQYNWEDAYWEVRESDALRTYATIDWEDITDAQYNALPQEMIDKFLNKLFFQTN